MHLFDIPEFCICNKKTWEISQTENRAFDLYRTLYEFLTNIA